MTIEDNPAATDDYTFNASPSPSSTNLLTGAASSVLVFRTAGPVEIAGAGSVAIGTGSLAAILGSVTLLPRIVETRMETSTALIANDIADTVAHSITFRASTGTAGAGPPRYALTQIAPTAIRYTGGSLSSLLL